MEKVIDKIRIVAYPFEAISLEAFTAFELMYYTPHAL